MMKSSQRGFTLVEMVITLALLVILLAIATPTAWEYYRRQRFDQAVQSLVSNIKAAQINAVSTGYWYAFAFHSNCPYRPGRLCVQSVRLPQGECSAGTIDWAGVPECTDTTPPSQVCEDRRLRNFIEDDIGFTPAGTPEYVISPMGMIFMYQSAATVCTALSIPNPPFQMTFQYPKNSPKWTRGLCLYSNGLAKKVHGTTC